MKWLAAGITVAVFAASAAAQDSTRVAAGAAAHDTLQQVVPLPEVVVVSTTRLDSGTPYARSRLGRDEIARSNWGQDTPMALATLPGVYAYSDAGNGIGYSYLNIRGFPQRRVSVSINGVPLNDPESHEVYWIDHPDLLASTTEVAVQRGVGPALYGAASIGGSVDMVTMPMASSSPSFAAATGYGSFDTRRFMVEGRSGALAGGWGLYGRYSRIETDGYRDQSDSRLWSYALSAQRQSSHQLLRLNLYGGPEETHLAYLGVPREYIDGEVSGDADRDRRYNPITYEGERDHFFEPHYELIHSWAPSRELTVSQTLFYFDGQGFYDEQRFGQSLVDYRLTPWATVDTTLFPRSYYRDDDQDGNLDRDGQGRATVERFDLVRKRFVKNRHYGWIPRLQIERGHHVVTVGGEIRAHDGHHIGTVISGSGLPPGTEPDHRYYDYHPRTLSAGLFAREEWQLMGHRNERELKLTADLAWRHQDYAMRDDHFDGIRFDQAYDFAIPRLALSWRPISNLTTVVSGAQSHREPAFRDLYDAEGVGSVPLFVNGEPLIRPERVNDFELGVSWWADQSVWTRYGVTMNANLFRMDFTDELVYAGQFNTDLGYPTIGNAAKSIHQGLELGATARLGKHSPQPGQVTGSGPALELAANATLSDNYFVDYTEHYGPTPAGDVSYDGNAIGFFPAVMTNVSARFGARGAALGLDAQYAGRIFLDNTETKSASIEPRTVLNLNGSYRLPIPGAATAQLALRVFNLLDTRYETGGYMDYDALGNLAPQFIPAANRNFLGELRVEW